MARIDIENIRKNDKMRNQLHDKVYATYTAFDLNGERFVQIDTYGKIERENPEKISQSFQFDRDAAEFLVELLQKEFNI